MMKIVSWNCNGAFRKKFEQLNVFNADIYIIQECENPASSNDQHYINWAGNYLWTGDSKIKGVGIFAKGDIILKRLEWEIIFRGYEVKHFLPCIINDKYPLLGVWTHKNNSPNFPYMGQFWKYLQLNKLNFKDIIIVGDFNSNSIWDQWDRWKNWVLKVFTTYFSGKNRVKKLGQLYFFRKTLINPIILTIVLRLPATTIIYPM